MYFLFSLSKQFQNSTPVFKDKPRCLESFNPTALRMTKTLWSFGSSECKRFKKGKPDLIRDFQRTCLDMMGPFVDRKTPF